ncbi:MAG TPA: hypothetical protein DDY71_09885 [Spirochaetia bacterium]|nr:hypothetical protein [Spirochaetia bacterium]
MNSDEKERWLKFIEAVELKNPWKYVALVNGENMYYSDEYLDNTPLDEIVEKYVKYIQDNS